MPRPEDASIPSDLGRRRFLGAASMLALGAHPGDPRPGVAPPMILRSREPFTLEFPFASLDGFLTPNERFYVLRHFDEPRLDARSWRLKVEGVVDRPLDLTLDDIAKLPTRKAVAMLECSGNGRVHLHPNVKGTQWDQGGVSNAEWAGVPMAAILERAGVRPGAVEVVLEGADRGELFEEPKTPGVIPFARSLPLEKARRDVLLAHRMNGAELPRAHGYPLRAIVPGWYGVASVKWLARIVVVDRPFVGYFQSEQYSYFERRDGLSPTVVQVAENQVKSQIARPGRDEVVPRDSAYRVFGAAWAGESDVVAVDLSTDGGTSWSPATLLGDPVPHAWRLWEFAWRTPDRPGPRTLLARARDARGRVQPMGRDSDRRGYLISHVLPVEVEVF